MNNIAPEMVLAFMETEYIVYAAPAFKMHIGQPCPELASLMAEHETESAAFITAWNPFSQQLSANENEQRQQELKVQLKTRGLMFFDGIGKHPSNGWPGEQSFLIMNINYASAKALAGKFEQHTFVWVDELAVPCLVQP